MLKRLLLLWTLAISSATAATIDRVEPPSWWVGMQSSKLQLLVKGDQIGSLAPQLDYPGVTISASRAGDDRDYLFIDLKISASAQAGTLPLRFMQGNKEVASYDYPLQKRAAGSAQRKGFSPADVIYLVMPDRFANGDPQNDKVDGMLEGPDRDNIGGRHGGDLQGIIDRLGYIEDMGFTQLWLNPVRENNMPAYSYHGYAMTDFYRIDPRYGSNELYFTLSREARKRGIGLIMDVVLNHSGSEHWWARQPPFKDWINNGNRFVPTTHRRETLHDPYGVNADRRGFTDGWFVNTMPDLNQRNPYFANYLIQNSIWWVESAGLSGIRVDTYPYSDKRFLAEWSRRVMAEYPRLNIVGEEWTTNPALLAYWQKGSHTHDGYVSELPSVFDFPLQEAVVKGLTAEEDQWNGLVYIYRSLVNDFLYGDAYNLVIFPDNHDKSRIYTQLGEDKALWRMAMAFFATTRGIPQIYSGTEILQANPDSNDHGVIRADFPGGWDGDTVDAFSGKNLPQDVREAQEYLRELLNWRKTSAPIHKGKLAHYAPADGLYVYFRFHGKEKVMVVLNKNDETTEVNGKDYPEMLKGFSRGTDALSGKIHSLKRFSVPARSALILELAP